MYNIQPFIIAVRRKVIFKEKSGFLQVNTEENTKNKYSKFGGIITKDIYLYFFQGGGGGKGRRVVFLKKCIFKSLK